MKNTTPAKLVAIVGGSGSGKTWLADRLHQVLGEVSGRLSLDHFYRDRSYLCPRLRERINYDHPRAIDWPYVEKVLNDCKSGRETEVPRYDFSNHTRLTYAVAWRPAPVTLMDGLWLLQRPAVRRLFDLKIYVDCPARLRAHRRMERDQLQRGRSRQSVLWQLKTTVEPMYLRYVAPQIKLADLVVNQPLREADMERLSNKVWELVKTDALLPTWMRETFRAELTILLKAKGTSHEKQ